MSAIFWKEMADHFGRRRFGLLFGLIIIGILWGTFVLVREVDGSSVSVDSFLFLQIFTSGSGGLPPLLFFVGFFGPLISIALGFDSINSERTQGTLSRVLAQPIYRDTLFTGKFLAGLTTLVLIMLTLMISILGTGMFIMGLAPRGEEVIRLVGFALVTTAYLGFWLALAMTYSIFFRNTVTSALVSLGTWLFLTLFLAQLIARAVADAFVPADEIDNSAQLLRHFNINLWIARLSPSTIFNEAAQTLLDPWGSRGSRSLDLIAIIAPERLQGLLARPISAAQSLRLVWPHIIVLISLVSTFLVASFFKFMREEIRS
jgi:ABC-2 type transport system permease protein